MLHGEVTLRLRDHGLFLHSEFESRIGKRYSASVRYSNGTIASILILESDCPELTTRRLNDLADRAIEIWNSPVYKMLLDEI